MAGTEWMDTIVCRDMTGGGRSGGRGTTAEMTWEMTPFCCEGGWLGSGDAAIPA